MLMPYRLHNNSATSTEWFDYDGLHLTTHGYDRLGTLLHSALRRDVSKQPQALE